MFHFALWIVHYKPIQNTSSSSFNGQLVRLTIKSPFIRAYACILCLHDALELFKTVANFPWPTSLPNDSIRHTVIRIILKQSLSQSKHSQANSWLITIVLCIQISSSPSSSLSSLCRGLSSSQTVATKHRRRTSMTSLMTSLMMTSAGVRHQPGHVTTVLKV